MKNYPIKVVTKNGISILHSYSIKKKIVNGQEDYFVSGLDENGKPIRSFEWLRCTGIKSYDHYFFENDIVATQIADSLVVGVVVFNSNTGAFCIKVADVYLDATYFKGKAVIGNISVDSDIFLTKKMPQISKDLENEVYNAEEIEEVSLENDNFVIIYTDGGCESSIGGYATIVTRKEKAIAKKSGFAKSTTNNRMELTAAIEALRYLKYNNMSGKIISDSTYVVDGASKWLNGWVSSGKLDRGEVKNADLWKELLELKKDVTVRFCWVRGHSGNRFNEACDELCVSEIAKGKVS